MNEMILHLPIDRPLIYHLTGKFSAPSPEWTHMNIILTDYELIVMTKGVLYLSYNGAQYAVGEGQYLLLPPCIGQPNMRGGYRPSDCEFYWLHFATADERFYKIPNPPFSGDERPEPLLHIAVQGQVPYLDKLVILMRQLQNNVRMEYAPLALNYETSVVLWELHNQLAWQASEQEKISQEVSKQIHHDIMDFVKENSTSNLRVSDVAEHFGYNAKYLSHLFIKLTGIPLKQFILRCKMDDASLLLTDTNLSIGDIAQKMGYDDAHNFSRMYKKIMGISPSDYRSAYAQRLLFHV